MYLRVVAATAMCLAIASCDGGISLSTQVIDSEGMPIPHVAAHASSEKSPEVFDTVSDKDGCLSFRQTIESGQYDFTVVATAQGYKTLKFSIPTLRPNNYRLVMAKSDQAFNSQAQLLSDEGSFNSCGGI